MNRLPQSPDEWVFLGVLAVLALAYDRFIRQLMSRRNRAGRCARCGKPLDPDQSFDAPIDPRVPSDTAVMCYACADTNARNLRAPIVGFLVLACVLTLVVMLGGMVGYRRILGPEITAYKGILIVAILLAAAIITIARTRPRRRKQEDEQDESIEDG